MEYTTLLLDMDGTFLDFSAAEHSAFYRAMEAHGYPCDEESYRIYSRINHSLWEAFERGEIDKPTLLFTRFGRLFEQLGIDGDGAAFEEEYQMMLGEGHELIEGAQEVLDWLFPRYDLYVVTNGVEATQRNRLKLSGLDRFMKDIFCVGGGGLPEAPDGIFRLLLSENPGFPKGKDHDYRGFPDVGYPGRQQCRDCRLLVQSRRKAEYPGAAD